MVIHLKKLSLLFIIIFLFVGCNNMEENIVKLPNGDLQETTASREELPTFLNDESGDLQNVYLIVAQHQDLLEKIPCYCGCGDSAGHEHSFHCFVADIASEGVTWDDHSTRCPVCIDTAAESVIMSIDGKNEKEIRQFIDEKYQEGYAIPTPTPKIS